MAVRATLRVEGFRDAILRADEIGERARRPEPALRAAATSRDLQDGEQRRFRRPFRPVTPKWAAEKRRRGLDARNLRATGRLERALTGTGPAAGVRHTVFNAELRWGILRGRGPLYYAQTLAKDGRRRMVVIDREARNSIARRVSLYIATGFTDADELRAARRR